MTSTSPLGQQLSVFHGQPLRWRELVFGFIPGSLLSIALLLVGFWRSYYGFTRYGPAAAINWSRPCFLTSLFITLVILILAIQRIDRSHRKVAVHENGLVIFISLLKRKTFYWTEISAVTVQSERLSLFLIPFSTNIRVVIYPYHGRPVRLGKSISDLAGLISRIKNRLYPLLMSNFIQDLNRGRWIHFGELSIHKSGLRIRSRQFNLTEVRAVKVLAGNLVVELSNDRQQSVPVSQIPNLELLFQLINQWINR